MFLNLLIDGEHECIHPDYKETFHSWLKLLLNLVDVSHIESVSYISKLLNHQIGEFGRMTLLEEVQMIL